MRSRTLYDYPPRRRRVKLRFGHTQYPMGEFMLLLVVLVAIVVGARLDYLAQRDCHGNRACLEAVM